MAKDTGKTESKKLEVHRPMEIDYVYRDFFSVYAGQNDVLIELGNVDRASAGQVRVANRVVLSVPNAKRLRDTLSQAVEAVEKRGRKA